MTTQDPRRIVTRDSSDVRTIGGAHLWESVDGLALVVAFCVADRWFDLRLVSGAFVKAVDNCARCLHEGIWNNTAPLHSGTLLFDAAVAFCGPEPELVVYRALIAIIDPQRNLEYRRRERDDAVRHHVVLLRRYGEALVARRRVLEARLRLMLIRGLCCATRLTLVPSLHRFASFASQEAEVILSRHDPLIAKGKRLAEGISIQNARDTTWW